MIYQSYFIYKKSIQVNFMLYFPSILMLLPFIIKFSCLIFIILVIDEWGNFMERINIRTESESTIWNDKEKVLKIHHWASLRGQTLFRTGNLTIMSS